MLELQRRNGDKINYFTLVWKDNFYIPYAKQP